MKRLCSQSHTHTQQQFRVVNKPKLQVFGMWEETGAAGQKPPLSFPGKQTPLHYQNPSSSTGSTAAVLTTEPP